MVDIKCRDCGKTLEGPSPHKHFCPSCVKKHKNQRGAKYRHSAKGQQKAHAYYLAHKKKFCSRPKEPCPKCGQPKLTISKLCRACKDKDYRAEKHHSWKGGRFKANGYILIKKPSYPRAMRNGYVLEHILVWETCHNKPLPKGWEVHHYNGVRDDNRPSNLFAKSKKQHRLVIPELQKRIQELEALLNNQHQLL